MSANKESLNFDAKQLRDKYRLERDKRLRVDGNEQYQEVTGRFSHFVTDPYVAGESRAPISSDFVEIAIIGGGFGGAFSRGQATGGRADRCKGSSRKAGDFGGTWYWNRYPRSPV